MASKNYSVQLINIRPDGTRDNINPITKAKNVKVTPINNIPEEAINVAKVLELLGSLAFKNTVIDDTQASMDTTLSSSKIYELLDSLSSGNLYESLMALTKRVDMIEDYLAKQSDVVIDETGMIDLPTVYATIEDEEMTVNSTVMPIKNTTIYT